MRGGCCNQHHCLDNFTFESISLEPFVFGRECSGLFTGLFTGGRSVLWPNNSCLLWETGGWYYCILWRQDTSWRRHTPSYLLARPERWEQKEFLLRSKARICHSKKSWLNHFGLINKFVLPLQSLSSSPWTRCQQNNNVWRPTTTEDQSLNYEPRWTMVVNISLLLPIRTPCFMRPFWW